MGVSLEKRRSDLADCIKRERKTRLYLINKHNSSALTFTRGIIVGTALTLCVANDPRTRLQLDRILDHFRYK